nr:hypothetical protein Q903MT_gene5997 [Picea sitchensis]
MPSGCVSLSVLLPIPVGKVPPILLPALQIPPATEPLLRQTGLLWGCTSLCTVAGVPSL